MRGEQLARQWRILRTIESRNHGISVTELARQEGWHVRTIWRDPAAIQDAGFPLYAEKDGQKTRYGFIEGYKLHLPVPFTVTELMSLYFYRDILRRCSQGVGRERCRSFTAVRGLCGQSLGAFYTDSHEDCLSYGWSFPHRTNWKKTDHPEADHATEHSNGRQNQRIGHPGPAALGPKACR
ncbi:MAG: HTH domain-containing protein [Deltaproteobacteria bacterium]|nr:HTH domain-containing protein [Deltaproteobacteria bacterium]